MTMEPVGYNHRLRGYTQFWKYFKPCQEAVAETILFKEDIVVIAEDVVRSLRKTFPHNTLVGVHVRMEDHTRRRAVTKGKTVAPSDYYARAMTNFRGRYSAVTFVVIASKPDWFGAIVTSASDVVYLDRSDSPAVDMEILACLDHVIISVGKFG